MKDLERLKLPDNHIDESEENQEDPRIKQFTVSSPVKIGGHIKYTVTGVDGDGPFEEVRRFSQFFALKHALSSRWPGVYIPSLPEKKLVGNNDDKFIEERRSLLERFMKEIGKHDYIIYSREFKLFAREKGEVEKTLGALTKQTPMQMLEKYRLNFNVDED